MYGIFELECRGQPWHQPCRPRLHRCCRHSWVPGSSHWRDDFAVAAAVSDRRRRQAPTQRRQPARRERSARATTFFPKMTEHAGRFQEHMHTCTHMHEKEEKEAGSPRPSPPGRSRRAARVEVGRLSRSTPRRPPRGRGESLKRVFTLCLHVQHPAHCDAHI